MGVQTLGAELAVQAFDERVIGRLARPREVERHVVQVREELNRDELRAEAAEALRALISEVRLVPEGDHLEIELAGDLVGILALTSDSKKPATASRDGRK